MRVPSSTPGGIVTCRLRSRCTVPAPWQILHGLRITRPWPPQVGQVRSTRKKPCCARILPAPLQVGQVSAARCLVGRAGAAARLAGDAGRHAQLRLGAGERLGQVDLDGLADVRARCAGRPPPRRAHEVAEHLVEDVAQPAGAAEVEAAGAARAALLERRVPETVVGGALLLVLQDVVGLVDLLELRLGLLVAGVAVRVVLHRGLR